MVGTGVAATSAGRRELGVFLRARRERVAPGDVGLPGSLRRRTPGLRREELAMLAGISATWYTYLEQGRDVRPSEQVLTAIARALRLGDAEHAHLLSLAGDATPPPLLEVVAPEVAAVPGLVDPAPSYVTGATTDVLALNRAAAELFLGLSGTAAAAAERPNLARWVFLDPAAREVLVDWADVAQSVLARLRANAGRAPRDARFTDLVDELCDGSADARAWWPRYDIASNRSGTKQVRHPARGRLSLSYASFTVAQAPEQVLVVYRYDADADAHAHAHAVDAVDAAADVRPPSPARP